MSIASKPAPKGWPRISSSLAYQNANAAIDFLCKAFGFEVRLKVDGDGGKVVHSELVLGDGLVMVGDSDVAGKDRGWYQSPKTVNGTNTQSLFMYVDDVEAHCERARKAGATIATEPKTSDYGDGYWVDRSYEAVDPEGHRWWIAQGIHNK